MNSIIVYPKQYVFVGYTTEEGGKFRVLLSPLLQCVPVEECSRLLVAVATDVFLKDSFVT